MCGQIVVKISNIIFQDNHNYDYEYNVWKSEASIYCSSDGKGKDQGKGQGKGKSVPLQAWIDPEGSRRLRLPDFKRIDTWKW